MTVEWNLARERIYMIKVKQNAFGVGDNYAIVSGSSPCEARKRPCELNPLLNDSYVCLIFIR